MPQEWLLDVRLHLHSSLFLWKTNWLEWKPGERQRWKTNTNEWTEEGRAEIMSGRFDRVVLLPLSFLFWFLNRWTSAWNTEREKHQSSSQKKKGGLSCHDYLLVIKPVPLFSPCQLRSNTISVKLRPQNFISHLLIRLRLSDEQNCPGLHVCLMIFGVFVT